MRLSAFRHFSFKNSAGVCSKGWKTRTPIPPTSICMGLAWNQQPLTLTAAKSRQMLKCFPFGKQSASKRKFCSVPLSWQMLVWPGTCLTSTDDPNHVLIDTWQCERWLLWSTTNEQFPLDNPSPVCRRVFTVQNLRSIFISCKRKRSMSQNQSLPMHPHSDSFIVDCWWLIVDVFSLHPSSHQGQKQKHPLLQKVRIC